MKKTPKKTFAFVLAITLVCSCAQAQLVQTYGGVDCGVWVQDKKSSDRAWLLGYMTGLNMDSSGNPLGKITSAQQIFLWMDNYCMKSPLGNPVQGGRELLDELKKR
jgi:hypothetical protein